LGSVYSIWEQGAALLHCENGSVLWVFAMEAEGEGAPPDATPTAAEDAADEWPEDEPAEAEGTGPALTLECHLSEDSPADGGDMKLAVSIQVPDVLVRPPVDICCVVDISGSMGEVATYEQDGVVKDDGLTILDIVKHAVKTVVHTLKDEDRFALVAFDENVDRVLALTVMTEAGREQAVAAVNSLEPRGRTNIWGGVLEGMEALREPAHKAGAGRLKTLLLLTDGLPNISPPRGHVAELKDYKEKHPDFGFQISTFGFGYSLDSELLLGLAVEGNGTYAFIPDAVIVGTVFVNAVANALSTMTQDATMHLMALGEGSIVGPVSGGYEETTAAWGKVVSLGPLQFGQSREIVVPVRVPPGMEPYFEAVVIHPTQSGREGRASAQSAQRTGSQTGLVATARNEIVSVGYKAVLDACSNKGRAAQQSVEALKSGIATYEVASVHRSSGGAGVDSRLAALKADLEGRMSKALKGKERFNRWGKHYLRALMRAHQVQQCTNFMDPGLQVYGGTLFRECRSQGDDVFLSLPPPKPSRARPPKPLPARPVVVAAASPAVAAAPAYSPPPPRPRTPSPDMRTYYGGGGGG